MPASSRRNKPDNPWTVTVVPTLSGGVNSSLPADQIDDSETTITSNLSIRDGRVRYETGYGNIGSNTTLRGTPKGGITRRFDPGNPIFMLVTDDTVYKYMPGAQFRQLDEWHYIAWGDNADSRTDNGVVVTDADANGGATSISVPAGDETVCKTDDYIGILLDSSSQHQAQVSSTASGTINFSPALPGSGVVASSGAQVVLAVELSGDDDNQVVMLNVPSNDWTVFVNNKDFPMRYDGTDVRGIEGLSSVLTGATDTARTCALYRSGYLFFGGLIINGTIDRSRAIWCDTNNPTEWVLGDAGQVPLSDTDDDLVAMLTLGDDLIMYRNKSIVRVRWVGQEGNLFSFTTLIQGVQIGAQGVGAISSNGVINIDQGHLVFSSDGMYLLTTQMLGGGSVQDVSNKIFEDMFSPSGDFDSSLRHRSFIYFSDFTNEVFFCYPAQGRTFCKSAWVLDIERGTWRKRQYGTELTFGAYRPLSAGEDIRIQDLVGTIAEQDWIIGGPATQVGAPLILLGDHDNTKVVEANQLSSQEDGSDIFWEVQTKDWFSPDRELRVDWIELEYSGGPMAIARRDDDNTPISIAILPNQTSMKPYRIYSNQWIGRRIMFWILFLGNTPQIGRLSFKWREESNWTL